MHRSGFASSWSVRPFPAQLRRYRILPVGLAREPGFCISRILEPNVLTKPDSSGLPEGLLDQRFERWVGLRASTRSALQRAYHRHLIFGRVADWRPGYES